MRAITAITALLVACSGPASMPDPDVDAAEVAPADLGHAAGDGAIAQVDAARPPADASSPGDAALAPPDMTPACGAVGTPCCAPQVCTVGEGGYCNGTCGGTWTGCRMTSGVPTCQTCGLVGDVCCAASPRCVGGSTCGGPSSANAGRCG